MVCTRRPNAPTRKRRTGPQRTNADQREPQRAQRERRRGRVEGTGGGEGVSGTVRAPAFQLVGGRRRWGPTRKRPSAWT